MAGLDPAIFAAAVPVQMAWSSPAMTRGASAARQHLGRSVLDSYIVTPQMVALGLCYQGARSTTTKHPVEPLGVLLIPLHLCP
jgi:hypothetical protein